MKAFAWFALLTSTAVLSLAGPFTNGGFESPGIFSGDDVYLLDGSTFVTGWTHTGTSGEFTGEFYSNGAAWGITAGEGVYYVGFGAGGVTGGTFSQTFDTTAGQMYWVNYLLTTQELTGPLPDQATFVEALDGTTVLASVSNTINTPAGVWVNGQQLVFTATSSSTTLRFTDLTSLVNGAPLNWGLDNVAVTTPEPASYSLIGLGLCAIVWRKRRSK